MKLVFIQILQGLDISPVLGSALDAYMHPREHNATLNQNNFWEIVMTFLVFAYLL